MGVDPVRVEPIHGEPAATAAVDGDRLLLVGDYHAGIEAGLRYERGVELPSNAAARRERLCGLLDRTDADRLVVLGDLGHRIGPARGEERAELEALYDAVVGERGVPITVVPGNHDGDLAAFVGGRSGIDILSAAGGLLGTPPDAIGVLHGHTWPDPELCAAATVCMAHEHPQVNLTDSVGGSRTERAWLRGRLDPAAFLAGSDAAGAVETDAASDDVDDTATASDDAEGPELVVFPAFNERSGGTWVNIEGQAFLSPFLPGALLSGELYLFDGTRLGPYRAV